MLRGRATALAAALAFAAVAAGCGGGSTSGALQLDPVSAAATKTQDAGTARVRFNIRLSGRGQTFHLHGTGALDGKSTEMTFGLGSIFRQTGLPAGVGSNATMAQLRHAAMTEVALHENGDYVIYIRLPAFLMSQLPGGKQWLKLDLSKVGKSSGLDLGKLMSGNQFLPTDLLSMLKAEGAKVTKVGSATIDGTAATQYRVKVDMAKALRSKGLADNPLLSGVAAHVKPISENVWVGNDGLLRRVQLSYSDKDSPRVAMTMDLYDYGADVSVAAPPSSRVFDATLFAQQGLGSYMH